MDTIDNTRIENTIIKGLSLRSLFWLLSCTVTIMLSIFTVYFNLKEQIRELQIQGESQARYNELRIKDVDNKADVNAIEIREIKRSIQEDKDQRNFKQ